ncbi:uncharacterized protein VP01_1758g1 [Puccinia sorghi]|uniref:Uncharacterized protein n=1 Tax=Puccinia sorghi TaxID=27349 RepID=A0A0L6VGT6_9BASI|nr:uncharacterized protein VP01_1758g1 [Puccinia sorghi]
MPPKATKPPPRNPNTSQPSRPKQKKAAIEWDTSIRIILDWPSTEGNYQRWRGDNKSEANKTATANGILNNTAKAGITHHDARDFLRASGAGILDEDIEEGTTTNPYPHSSCHHQTMSLLGQASSNNVAANLHNIRY